jgi:hypothetical protein
MTPARIFIRLLYALAVIWLVASLAIHFATFWGIAPVGESSLNRMMAILHVGTLIVYFPALCIGRWLAGTFRPREYVQGAVRYASAFYKKAAAVLVGYAGVAFLFCLVAVSSPERYLKHGGGVVDNLRAVEFRSGQVYGLRLFSCIWIACCAIAVVILASAKNAPEDDRPPAEGPDALTRNANQSRR